MSCARSASRSSTCSTRSAAPPAPRSSRSRRSRRSRSSSTAKRRRATASTWRTCRTSSRPASVRRRSRRSTSASAIYPLTVRYTEASRNQPDALGNLLGAHRAAACRCRCHRSRDIRVQPGESTVTRENGQRNLTIRIDNRDRDLTSYLEEAQAKIARTGALRSRTGSAWNGAASSRTSGARKRACCVILGHGDGPMLILLTVGIGLVAPGRADSRRGAAGDARRLDLAAPDRPDAQRRQRRGLHRALRRRGAERHHHGGEPEPHA